MLWNEFIDGVKCKDTEYNYSVYKDLEKLYMANENLSKEDIYKSAKLLVDNSETLAEKESRESYEREVAEINDRIDVLRSYVRDYECARAEAEYSGNKAEVKECKKIIKGFRTEINYKKDELKSLKLIYGI